MGKRAIDAEEAKRRLVREKGWYVPALHERYIEIMEEKAQAHSLMILRAALGIIFFRHGSQKLLGWFGGLGYDATVQIFQA